VTQLNLIRLGPQGEAPASASQGPAGDDCGEQEAHRCDGRGQAPHPSPTNPPIALASVSYAAKRQHLLDVIRKLHYLAVRKTLLARSKEMLDHAGAGDLRGRKELPDTPV